LAIIARVRHYLTNLVKRDFIRNVAAVATGTIVVQIIVIIASPFITRLYGPEAFGVLGIFVAMIAIFSPLATLTYSTAIVLPDNASEAKGIAVIALITATTLSLLIAIVLLLFKPLLVPLFNLESVADYLFLLPVAIILMAVVQILHQWLIRTGQFRKIASLSIYKALIVNGSKVGVGFIHATAAVLIVLATLGYLIHAVLFYIGTRGVSALKRPGSIWSENLNLEQLKHLAGKYRKFPFYRAPQMLLNALTKSLPLLLLAYFFTPVAAGFYAIGQRVLLLPSGIIGKSIGNVYYPRIAKAANNKEDFRPYIRKATLGMAALAAVPILVIVLFGPVLFEFVFGFEWRMAGHYARWLSFLVFFDFILHPGKDAMLVYGFQKMLLGFEIAGLMLKTVMLVVGFYVFKDEIIALLLFSMSGVLISVLMMIVIRSKSKTAHATASGFY